MNFTKTELDLVQNHWVDISQDPDFISQETGIDKNDVIDMLRYLSDKGRIDNFDTNKRDRVRTFKEMFNH